MGDLDEPGERVPAAGGAIRADDARGLDDLPPAVPEQSGEQRVRGASVVWSVDERRYASDDRYRDAVLTVVCSRIPGASVTSAQVVSDGQLGVALFAQTYWDDDGDWLWPVGSRRLTIVPLTESDVVQLP